MALLGYQGWKAAKVESRECSQTIRARRKTPVKVGETLYHYSGLRSRAARKVLTSVCTETFEIRLAVDHGGARANWEADIPVDFHAVARLDGFADITAMTTWFLTNHPVKSGETLVLDVIRW